MKKKLLLGFIALFVSSVFLINANAATTQYPALFRVPVTESAKAPTTIPANNSTVYATLTDEFDFSKVIFKDSRGNDLLGKSDLKKIIIGDLNKSEITDNNSAKKSIDTLFTNWFTAYCLDQSKKYPEFGLFSSGGYRGTIDIGGEDIELGLGYSQGVKTNGTYDPYANSGALQWAVALANIMNDPRFSYLTNDLLSEFPTYFTTVKTVDYSAGTFEGVSLGFSDEEPYYRYLMGEISTSQTVGIEFVGFTNTDSIGYDSSAKYVFYIASDDDARKSDIRAQFPNATIKYLTGTPYSEQYYPLNYTLRDLAFSKYEAKDDKSITNYNHALWIVENSYPTLDISTALSKAGVNIETLDTQIATLYGSLVNASNKEAFRENVVYGVVQYAIWKVTGARFGTSTLGSEISNSTELDKLYKYLVLDRPIYNGYSDAKVYDNKITITAPASGKELKETTKDAYIYGPYKATYNALNEEGNKITVALTSAAATGVKVVDATKKEITELEKGQEFYISVSKNIEIKKELNITATLELKNITTFEPTKNRGRVYYPVASFAQNAMSGGKTSLKNITGELNLKVISNPATGAQNIALLLMVTLVAFTLGYLALSYKQKPITLNQ